MPCRTGVLQADRDKVAASGDFAMTANGQEINFYPGVGSPRTVVVQNLGQTGESENRVEGGKKPLTGSIGTVDIIDSCGRFAIKIIRGSPL